MKSGRHTRLNKRQATTYHLKHATGDSLWVGDEFNSKCEIQKLAKAYNRATQRYYGRLSKYDKVVAVKY